MIKGDVALIKELLDKGADIHARIEGGFTALTIASMQQPKEIVELLLKNGANPNQENNGGNTALAYAEENPNEGVVELLKHILTTINKS